MRKIQFKRYDHVSLYEITKTFFRNLEKDQIIDRANGVAFNFIMAIFPGILFLFTLTPYISKVFPQLNRVTIIGYIEEMIPASMAGTISSTVEDMLSNTRGGLLTFGFVFSLFLATNGMMSLMRAFNACYKTIEKRGALKMRLIATGLTFTLVIVLLLATGLLVVGQLAITYASEIGWMQNFSIDFILFIRFAVIFTAFFLAIAFIYYFGPAIHYNWKFFSIGSLVATLLCLAVSYGFSFYINNFGTYNKVYGSIGALIAMMIWVQLVTVVLLFGYEINVSIHDAIRTKAILTYKKTRKI
jgi:membrane protein